MSSSYAFSPIRMSQALEILSVSKIYRTDLGRERVVALKDVSLEVQEGEVFALLGLNGSGKSTLIRCVLDLVRPTSGKIFLFGEPLRDNRGRHRIGYLPELFGVPKGMTAIQVLQFLGQLSGLEKEQCSESIHHILTKVGLTDAAQRKAESYSKGMTLRLGIAQALLHKPRIVFLDEPTDGLDPLGRKMIRDLISHLSTDGVTVFMNSHLFSEVELLADRIAILHRGRIVLSGILKDLLPSQRTAAASGSTLEELFFAFLKDRDDDQNNYTTYDS